MRVPEVRATVRRWLRQQPRLGHDAVVGLAEALWQASVHERRLAAVELLVARRDLLDAADLDLVERLLRESRTWALLDGLAINVVGDLRARQPRIVDVRLGSWSEDPDFWLRRASLLAHLVALRSGDGDFTRFAVLGRPFRSTTPSGSSARRSGGCCATPVGIGPVSSSHGSNPAWRARRG